MGKATVDAEKATHILYCSWWEKVRTNGKVNGVAVDDVE